MSFPDKNGLDEHPETPCQEEVLTFPIFLRIGAQEPFACRLP